MTEDAGAVPTIVPDKTMVGTIDLVDEHGVVRTVCHRLVEDGYTVDVVWQPETARKIAIAMLRQADALIPLEPQHDAVALRTTGGPGSRLPAIREVVGAMFETGPDDPEELVRHVVHEHSLNPFEGMTIDEVRALHRALHAEGEQHG